MTYTICVLLWARPGRAADLLAYEDAAQATIGDYDGTVVQRLICRDGTAQDPDEIHVLRFPSEAAFVAYLADPRRDESASDRLLAIDHGVKYVVEPRWGSTTSAPPEPT